MSSLFTRLFHKPEDSSREPLLRSPRPIRNRNTEHIDRLPDSVAPIIDSKKSQIGKLLIKGSRSFLSSGVGSGILISERHFLTSRHAVLSTRQMGVRFDVYKPWHSGKTYPVLGTLDLESAEAKKMGVKFTDHSDLVILELGPDTQGRLPGSNGNFTPLADPKESRLDSLHFLGYTSGTFLKISDMAGSPLELTKAIQATNEILNRHLVWNDWKSQAEIMHADSETVCVKTLSTPPKDRIFTVQDGIVHKEDGKRATQKQDFFVLLPIVQEPTFFKVAHRTAPGSSGGVYFNQNGELVAIHCGRIPSDRYYPEHIALSPHVDSCLSDIPHGLQLETKDQQWAAYLKKHNKTNTHFLVTFMDFICGQENVGPARNQFHDEAILDTFTTYSALTGADANRLDTAKQLWDKKNNMTLSDGTALVRHLLFFSQEIAFEQAQKLDLTQVKVGTEFTFSNDLTRSLTGVEKLKKLPDPILKLMTSWKIELEKIHSKNPKFKVLEDHLRNPPFFIKFEYTLANGKKWWWALGLDEACVELQMCPTSYTDFKDPQSEIAQIIRKDIFTTASKLGLTPDPTDQGGGGHLSLDMKGLCGDSVLQYLRLIQNLQTNAASWPITYPESDVLNTPWLKDQGDSLKKFTQKIAALEAFYQCGELGFGLGCATLFRDGAKELESFFKTVTNPETDPKKGLRVQDPTVRSVRQNPLHYQAVNIEHVTTSKEAERRIEFRRIPAQQSYDDFITHLDSLFDYVKSCWPKK